MSRINLSSLVASFVLILSGCVLEQAPDARPADNQPETSNVPTADAGGSMRRFDLNPVVIVSRLPDNGQKRTRVGQVKPQDSSEPQMPDEEIPTNILIATCVSGAAEVAVPLNAGDGKFCDTVQVYPYREDDNGAYGVSADIEWQISELNIASFAAPAYGPGGNVRRLASATDAFWSNDEWDEPETLLTVCAKPPANMPHAFLPICRSLPVRATINIEGAWCFSGTTFSSNCQDVEIKQDGRALNLDGDVLANGLLWVRSITFNRDNDHQYDGVLDSHDYMYGIVRLNGHTEVLGTWTAWKLPLY